MFNAVNNRKILESGEGKLAIVGLSPSVVKWAKTLEAKVDEVLFADPLIAPDYIRREDNIRGSAPAKNIRTEDFRQARVYYLNGESMFADSMYDIKEYATMVAHGLTKGDWVIFGKGIDLDFAELLLVPHLEDLSGLKLGTDFDIAFMNSEINPAALDNLNLTLKLSHNLIHKEVAALLGLEFNDRGQVEDDFLDPREQYNKLIARDWVPVINEMDYPLFLEFYDACFNGGFLRSYPNLILPGEREPNANRFFTVAKKEGMKFNLPGRENMKIYRKQSYRRVASF